MNKIDENDGETALFLHEMSDETVAKTILLFPGETRFDIASVHKIVRHRNEMVQLLHEFLALHPEESNLTRRARRFT